MLIKIGDMLPPGTQMASPGGFSFNPRFVSGVEGNGWAGDPRVIVHLGHGDAVTLRFHRNVDGGPPDVYGIQRNIETVCNKEEDR